MQRIGETLKPYIQDLFRVMDFSQKEKCKVCGKPYRTIQVPESTFLPPYNYQVVDCDCSQEIDIDTVLVRAGISERFRCNFPVSQHWEIIDTFLQSEKSLFIFGEPGVGISTLASIILRKWYEKKKQSIFCVYIPSLDYQALQTIDTWKIKNSSLVLFDDIDKPIDRNIEKKWVSPHIYGWIDYRYREKKKTILTANSANPKKYTSLYSDPGCRSPFVSRLKDFLFYECQGEDRRGREK